jgi:beta-lactamase regulating signal transducer with metallopeptidase domain
MHFTIGDGQTYGGAVNKPLDPGHRYRVHYLAQTSANNETKYGIATMASPILTLLPNTPTPNTTTSPTTTTTPFVAPQTQSSSVNSEVLIGVILALLFVIILIIVIVFLVIWWRRRQNMKMLTTYTELDEPKVGTRRRRGRRIRKMRENKEEED